MHIKKYFSAGLLAFSTLLSLPLHAAQGTIVLTVPFAFVVEGRTLPAGAYAVEETGNLVYIRGNHAGVIVPSLPFCTV